MAFIELIVVGILASLAAGLATSVGALPILLGREIPEFWLDVMLGFAAGVMIAASAFSLLVPALEMETGGVYVVSLGLLAGGVFIHIIDRWAPHKHFISGPEGKTETEMSKRLAATWLFVIAITIHNFPEGLAVGVSFGSGDVETGLIVALAIGLQNIPEGTAVALPLFREGYSRWRALGITAFTGLVEPIGATIGVLAVSLASGMLGFGMAFAAGAMIFVVSDEIIPESHRKGHERPATFGVLMGFLIMMFLDNFIKIAQ
ncbi:MAG: ZIP family metal transporter [Candidatus Hodarchaeales archaeon]